MRVISLLRNRFNIPKIKDRVTKCLESVNSRAEAFLKELEIDEVES
jgi:hypothetical protein